MKSNRAWVKYQRNPRLFHNIVATSTMASFDKTTFANLVLVAHPLSSLATQPFPKISKEHNALRSFITAALTLELLHRHKFWIIKLNSPSHRQEPFCAVWGITCLRITLFHSNMMKTTKEMSSKYSIGPLDTSNDFINNLSSSCHFKNKAVNHFFCPRFQKVNFFSHILNPDLSFEISVIQILHSVTLLLLSSPASCLLLWSQ